MKHICIIGSGPAGCYLADQLLRLAPDATIDVLEKLPVPFGLIRYGVAPDHQSTKVVSRLFDRVLSREQVKFFGNVEAGRDVRLAELMSLYDAVVLATGAPRDRKLGIPGEELPGVLGSGAFVNWYNGHPCVLAPLLNGVRSAVVIGNGNVALDVTRILAKAAEEFTGSDISSAVGQWLAAQPLETIHIIGRRGAADAKFNEHELAELGTLQRAQPIVADPAALTGDSPVVRTLRSFVEAPDRNTPVTIHFHFHLTPSGFVGGQHLHAVQFRNATGAVEEIPAQLAVTCIGYETVACCTAQPANGTFANTNGKIDDRLYVVGWAKRGPSGTIPTNRTEAQQVAQTMTQEVTDGNRAGSAGLRKLLHERDVRWIDYEGWRRIDAAEIARAGAQRCRHKFSSTHEMLEAALAGELRTA